MNKRIRRKKHAGEFTEYGLSIAFKIDTGKTNIDEYCDTFIDAIESFGLLCGGCVGRPADAFVFTIEVGKRDVAQENSAKVINWILDQHKQGIVFHLDGEELFYRKYLVDMWCNEEFTYLKAYKN